MPELRCQAFVCFILAVAEWEFDSKVRLYCQPFSDTANRLREPFECFTSPVILLSARRLPQAD